MKNGSSETIRKTTQKNLQISSVFRAKRSYSCPPRGLSPFHFEHPHAILPQHKNKINAEFLEWFIGFTEGNGSFLISPALPSWSSGQTEQDSNQVQKEPKRVFFIITQKEVQVLHVLRSHLGFGKVTRYGEYHRFIVGDLQSIDRLIHIFNGNILLKKVNKRFAEWVNARNHIHSRSTSRQDQKNVIVLKPQLLTRLKDSFLDQTFDPASKTPSQTAYLLSSAWLSGFIDAEGCFHIRKHLSASYSLGFRVRLRFILDQKNVREVFEEIKNQIQGGFILTRKEVELMYRYECTSFEDISTLQDYLKKYPLKSRKRFACKRLFLMLFYMKNRKSLPWTGKVLKRVERLMKASSLSDSQTNGPEEKNESPSRPETE